MNLTNQQLEETNNKEVAITGMRITTPGKLKGLKMAKRIKAIQKINLAKRLRRLSTRSGGGKTWIASVRKKITSSRPRYYSYNKGRNNSSSNNNNKSMIIIHNNTSITGNDDLDNRASCVDEAKDFHPSSPDEYYRVTCNLDDEIHEQLTPRLQQEEVGLREEKAVIHIQSVFRGHLARRACRALKSLVRLQAMARGVCVRRQARIALDCMNALLRLQFRVRARQLLNSSPTSQPLAHQSLDNQ